MLDPAVKANTASGARSHGGANLIVSFDKQLCVSNPTTVWPSLRSSTASETMAK